MYLFPKVIFAASVFAAFMAEPAQAKRAYHHHASFYANHPHYHQHSHHRSFAHHAAHYAAHYAVHYEIRRGVRAALAPIDGRDHAGTPRHVAAPLHNEHSHTAALDTPDRAPPAPSSNAPARTEFAHAGPRIGIDFALGDMHIVAVTEGSPAYVAGVSPGDIIIKANGTAITSAEDFAKAINAAAPSGALKLTVQRASREYNATIALDQGDVH